MAFHQWFFIESIYKLKVKASRILSTFFGKPQKSMDTNIIGRLGPLHVIVQTGMQSAVHWIWFRLSVSFNVYDWVDGVMMTWFGPSEKYIGQGWRYQNAEVITYYFIAEISIDDYIRNHWLLGFTKKGFVQWHGVDLVFLLVTHLYWTYRT
jgi:hypothetical protein